MSATFQVAVRLRGVRDPRVDDPEVEKLMRVLSVVTGSYPIDAAEKVCGGGGYGDPEGFPEERRDFACLMFQKNATPSGDLVDCDEADRERVGQLLLAHPLVEAAHVGPLDRGEEYRGFGEVVATLAAAVGGTP